MKRVLCVYFPRWPLQRRRLPQAEQDELPAVVSAPGTRGPQIVLASVSAERRGIRPGLPLAEARALEPRLIVHEEDLAADRRQLERLADWLTRFSPCVGLEEGPTPGCLLADITGCAPVFGGEDRLLAQAQRGLHAAGWQARLASAATAGAAWALAHHARTPGVVPTEETEQALAPLPVAALRLAEGVVHLLGELGIHRIGDLLALPRDEVLPRFGSDVLLRIDQALGRVLEVLVACRLLPPLQACQHFEYPVDHLGVLRFAFERLTEEVHAALAKRGWGARRLECVLEQESARPIRLEVSLFRPSGSFAHLWRLLRTRFEQVKSVEPVTALTLHVLSAEPLAEVQADFLALEQAEARKELAVLIDQLSSHLGREAVTRPRLVPDPQPEYACRFEPVLARSERREARAENKRKKPVRRRNRSPSLSPQVPVDRPLRLCPTPAPIEVLCVVPGGLPAQFRWAGKDFQVRRAWGPERIDTGWWRGHDIRRDYYVVATQEGTRFWLFNRHEEEGGWFLHGYFD